MIRLHHNILYIFYLIYSAGVKGFAPPSKEYLPPIDYTVKELGPNHPTLVPPSKEYLPPPSTTIEEFGHAIHVKEHHQHHVTVPPTFLPPHEGENVTPTFLPPHDKAPHHGGNYYFILRYHNFFAEILAENIEIFFEKSH